MKTTSEIDTKKVAYALKSMLIDLAINGKLPADLVEIPISRLQNIIKLAVTNIDSPKMQEIISVAGLYLNVGCEATIKAQIELIVAQSKIDASVMLDNVSGANLWKIIKNRFTVAEFLAEINYV